MSSPDLIIKVLKELLKPTEESILLLRNIEAKIDAQALSKLQGAFQNIEDSLESKKGFKIIIVNTLISLTEVSFYFKILMKKMKVDNALTINILKEGISFENPLSTAKIFYNDIINFNFQTARNITRKLISEYIKFINLLNLYRLSVIGQILCMNILGYSNELISKKYSTLVEHSDWKEFFNTVEDSFFLTGFSPYVNQLYQNLLEEITFQENQNYNIPFSMSIIAFSLLAVKKENWLIRNLEHEIIKNLMGENDSYDNELSKLKEVGTKLYLRFYLKPEMKHLVPYNQSSVENLINSLLESFEIAKKIYSSESPDSLFKSFVNN